MQVIGYKFCSSQANKYIIFLKFFYVMLILCYITEIASSIGLAQG